MAAEREVLEGVMDPATLEEEGGVVGLEVLLVMEAEEKVGGS